MKIELPPSSFITICFVLFISAIYFLSGISQRQLIKKQSREKALKVERPKPSMMFRGILIHQLGLFLNNNWLAIALGLFVNLGNHIYQGKLQITTHIIFCLTAVALLYSPFGLFGAIGFHFAGDIYPFLFLKTNAINYRNRRRNKRIFKNSN